jgi:hypothetical protein
MVKRPAGKKKSLRDKETGESDNKKEEKGNQYKNIRKKWYRNMLPAISGSITLCFRAGMIVSHAMPQSHLTPLRCHGHVVAIV